jgi:hypothetical protein
MDPLGQRAKSALAPSTSVTGMMSFFYALSDLRHASVSTHSRLLATVRWRRRRTCVSLLTVGSGWSAFRMGQGCQRDQRRQKEESEGAEHSFGELPVSNECGAALEPEFNFAE